MVTTRFDCDSAAVRLSFDCNSIRPRYERSTTGIVSVVACSTQ